MAPPEATAADGRAAEAAGDPPELPVRRRSMASDAAVLFLGGIFTQIAAIISLVVLAHLLPQADLGEYQQLLLVYAIASPLLLGGVPAALLYFMPRVPGAAEKQHWVRDAYLTLGSLGVVAALFLFGLRVPIASALGNDRLADALALYSPYIFFTFVNAVAPNALIATGQSRTAALLNGFTAALWLTAVVVSAAAIGSVESVAAAISIAAGITMVVSVVVVHRHIGIRAPGRRAEIRWRRLLGYGLPLALTGVLSTLGFQFDRLVVSRNFDAQQFAIYAVGAIEVPIAILVRQSMNSVLVPALSERHAAGDLPAMAEIWRGAMRKAALVMLPLLAILLVMAPELMRFAFGERYEDSAGIFRVYLALIPLGLASWGLLPMTAGRPGVNVGGAIAMLVVNGGLAVLLVGPLGMYGPAIATPLALLAMAIYFIVVIHQMLGFTPRELIPVRALLATAAVCALCAAPLFLLKVAPLGDFAALAISVPLFGLPCLLLLRYFRLIDDLDWGRVMAALAGARRVVARTQ